MTKIMGNAVATAAQMAAYLLSVNPYPKIEMPVVQFCQLYLDMAAKEGVRGDALFAQSCHETGNFKFPGTVTPDQNNYSGLGTLNATTKGAYFACEADGILAQAQHAKAYATKDPLCEACIDPRYDLLIRYGKAGTADHWEDLGGKWAVPGYATGTYSSLEEANAACDSYGYKIIKILNKILAVEVTERKDDVMGNSPLVDYKCISPNSTNPRNQKIKKITIHHMAGNLSVETCGNVFVNPERKASSNYGIDSVGRVGMYVEEKNRAWTSSSSDNDNQAVTIEVANDEIGGNWHVSDVALAKLILLCADICKRNGIEKLNFTGNASGNLTMHKWFKATNCPGPYLESKFPYIAEEVNKLLGTAQSVLYKVQVGAFVLKGNAEKLKTELEKKGITAFVTKVGLWYKVQTGAYSVKANADAMKKKLAGLGYSAIIVEVKQ